MNKDRLDKLLMSFYDGTTTLDEEKELMDFFASTSALADEYLADKELFLALSNNAKPVNIPSSLDDKLDSWLMQEESVAMSSVLPRKSRAISLKYRPALFLAASVFLLFAGYYIFKTNQTVQKTSLVAVELNVEESSELTEQVLLLLSSKLKQSVGAVDLAQDKVNDVSRVIHKLNLK